jgi:hypothetical protein
MVEEMDSEEDIENVDKIEDLGQGLMMGSIL